MAIWPVGVLVPAGLTLLPAALILKQPDLGTALIVVSIGFTMILFAVAAEKSLGRLFLAGIGPGMLLVGLFASCAPSLLPFVHSTLAQLGYEYAYGPDGNGGPAILDELKWGARAGEAPSPR